jgi:hypothetical protein
VSTHRHESVSKEPAVIRSRVISHD